LTSGSRFHAVASSSGSTDCGACEVAIVPAA
jgi:hypothetical protein